MLAYQLIDDRFERESDFPRAVGSCDEDSFETKGGAVGD